MFVSLFKQIMSKYFKTLKGEILYLGIMIPAVTVLSYWLGLQHTTGMFGPIKTKRYSTIQHWLDTGGGLPEETPCEHPEDIEWLEWDEMPLELRKPEWFCWQHSGETVKHGLTLKRFLKAHTKWYKD